MATLDTSSLVDMKETKDISIPEENWDERLSRGNINQVSVDYTEMLKIHDAKPQYVRVASLTHFDEHVISGLWAFSEGLDRITARATEGEEFPIIALSICNMGS